MISTYKELRDQLDKLEIAPPPYSGSGKLGVYEVDGSFWHGDEIYMPDEALKLGKWLVKFYEGADK